MRPGMVVTTRVNPKDCMSVLDILDIVGINIEGMSFPSMCSLAFSSLLEGARQAGQIPTRSGYEYNEMMGQYQKRQRSKRKLEITEALFQAGSELVVPALPPAVSPFMNLKASLPEAVIKTAASLRETPIPVPVIATSQSHPTMVAAAKPYVPTELSMEQRQAGTRLTELLQKKDLVDGNAPGVLWQTCDEEEFQALYKVVYPEG